jgi:hypothetical protein
LIGPRDNGRIIIGSCHTIDFVPYLVIASVCLLRIVPVGYAPDGMTPEQYRKLREKELQEKNAKNLGAYGPKSFQSRSLRSFQEDLEKGKTGHLMPVFNAKQKLAAGKIKPEDIPYMQRLGSWDNRDLGGEAKKVEGNKWDKVYNNADTAPTKFDWTGTGQRTGPRQPGAAAAKPNPQKKGGEPPKKKFGWF